MKSLLLLNSKRHYRTKLSSPLSVLILLNRIHIRMTYFSIHALHFLWRLFVGSATYPNCVASSVVDCMRPPIQHNSKKYDNLKAVSRIRDMIRTGAQLSIDSVIRVI